MNQQDQPNPELRRAFHEGTIAFSPIGWSLLPALSQALLMLAISAPLWFLGRCVFVEDWRALGTGCHAIPTLSVGQWTSLGVTLLGAGVAYVAVARLALRHNLSVSWRSGRYPLHSACAFILGLIVAGRIVALMYPPDPLTSFGRMVFLPLAVVCIWLWWWHLLLWAGFIGRRAWSRGEQVAVTVRMLVHRHLQLSLPGEIYIEALPDGLVVRGPIDAVDERRILDLIASRFTTPLQVQVETTLSEDLYWKSYRDPLQRSTYQTPPLPEPPAIPGFVAGSLSFLVLNLVVIALRTGPGLGIGITPEQIAQFYAEHNLVPPQTMSDVTAGRTLKASELSDPSELIYEPFVIDVEKSLDHCPSLEHTHWYQRSYMKLEGFVGPRINPDSLDDLSRYGDIVVRAYRGGLQSWTLFAFERSSGVCFMELETKYQTRIDTLVGAIRGVLVSEWVRMDRDTDWRYVPPMDQSTGEEEYW